MNIVKLQEELRNIPLNNLIQYINSPSGQVPSYLALAEIKRRKDMESRFAAQTNQAPETTVADELTQAPQGGLQMLAGNPMASEGAPTSQGVADLPVPDEMYNEQNFAGGGIVAFDNGGPVATSKLGDFLRGLGNRGATDIDKQIGALQAEKNKISYDIFSSYTPEQRAAQQQKLADIDAQIAALTSQRSSTADMPKVEKPAFAAPGLVGLNTPPTADNKLTNEDIGNIYRSTTPTKAPTVANNVPTREAPMANVDVTKPVAGPATTGIDSLLEDTTGLAESKKARYDQMMGENPERARLQDLITKYETGAGEQERMAPWMALTKAGFAMAGGKSPYALQNVSEGAMVGLSDYAQAKDKLDKLNERQIDIRSKLLQVDDARKSAAVTYGLNSEEHAATRNAQVKLKDMEEKNANARSAAQNATQIKGAQIAAAKKSDYETYIEAAKQDPDNYKTIKDKDGKEQKVFDSAKATQVWKSFSGSSGLDDDKLLAAWQQEKLLNPKFNLSLQDYIAQMRNKTPSAPAASSSWGPLKVK
jgi:hypothetical protein